MKTENIMKLNELKDLNIVLSLIAVVLSLVIFKSIGKDRFKADLHDAVEAVVSNNFSIALSELKSTEKDYMVVDLNESGMVRFENPIQIPFEKLLEKSSLQKLQESENKKILLVSDNNQKAVKAWVILNQLDFKNVFVLSTEENPEILKFEFQPERGKMFQSISE